MCRRLFKDGCHWSSSSEDFTLSDLSFSDEVLLSEVQAKPNLSGLVQVEHQMLVLQVGSTFAGSE